MEKADDIAMASNRKFCKTMKKKMINDSFSEDRMLELDCFGSGCKSFTLERFLHFATVFV